MAFINVYNTVDIDEIKLMFRRILRTVKNFKSEVMTKLSDIQAAHEELKTAISEEITQINDKISQLEQNVADGGSEEERAALLADIKASTDKVKGIIADSPAPEQPGDEE